MSEFKDALDWVAAAPYPDVEPLKTIRRALMIADRLMMEPSDEMIYAACSYHPPKKPDYYDEFYDTVKQMTDDAKNTWDYMTVQLLKEIDNAQGGCDE